MPKCMNATVYTFTDPQRSVAPLQAPHEVIAAWTRIADGYATPGPPESVPAQLRAELERILVHVRFWEKDASWLQARAAVQAALEDAQTGGGALPTIKKGHNTLDIKLKVRGHAKHVPRSGTELEKQRLLKARLQE